MAPVLGALLLLAAAPDREIARALEKQAHALPSPGRFADAEKPFPQAGSTHRRGLQDVEVPDEQVNRGSGLPPRKRRGTRPSGRRPRGVRESPGCARAAGLVRRQFEDDPPLLKDARDGVGRMEKERHAFRAGGFDGRTAVLKVDKTFPKRRASFGQLGNFEGARGGFRAAVR